VEGKVTTVCFDRNGRVVAKFFSTPHDRKPTFLEKIRGWLNHGSERHSLHRAAGDTIGPCAVLKRWWFWAGLGFLLVAIAAGYLVIPVGEGRISQATCDRIQLGMTSEQVRQLLGEPRGDFLENFGDIGVWVIWSDEDENQIAARFHRPSDKVLDKKFYPSSLNSLEKLKGRIERRVRALWP
jgi:hypothetical protein